MEVDSYLVVLILFGLISSSLGTYCRSGRYGRTIECSSGCCGSYGDVHCCDSDKVALIIGLVIGGVTLIAIIITVVICLKKNKGQRGQVIQPTDTAVGQQMFIVPTGPTAPAYSTPGSNVYPPVPANQSGFGAPPAYGY